MKDQKKEKSIGSEPFRKLGRRPAQKREKIEQCLGENRLKQQNELLAEILESLPHPFYVVDAHDYTIRVANSAAGSLGATEHSTCHALTHRQNTPCAAGGCICPLDEVKKTKKSVVVEHVHYDSEGNARHVEVHGHPIFDSDGNVDRMIEYCLDITERKRAEEERLQKEKLQGVLETAGAACHELNQPIQVLFAHLHSLVKRLPQDDPLLENIQEIRQEIKKMAEITHKLNNITRYESQRYFRDTKIIDINKASS